MKTKIRKISEKQYEARQKVAKEEIYEAALRAISRIDCESFTIQEIALEAGIATGTLYNYFKNKRELLCYIYRHLTEDILAIICNIINEQISADQKLRTVINAIFKFDKRYHVVSSLTKYSNVYGQIFSLEDKQTSTKQIRGYFEEILSAGIKQKLFRPVNIHRTAKILFQAMIGVLVSYKYFNSYDLSMPERDFTRFFLDYLRSK